MRLTHYRTVCSVGMCFTATPSLVHQLMCTHSPVTVCCVVVCGSPRAEGLTVSPAGRDVVDMVSFLADSEHKRSDVSSTSSARCGAVPQHTTTTNTRCGSVYCRTSPHTTQLSLPTHACDTPMVHVSTRKHTHTKWSSHQLTWQQGGALKLPHSTALPRTGQDRTGQEVVGGNAAHTLLTLD